MCFASLRRTTSLASRSVFKRAETVVNFSPSSPPIPIRKLLHRRASPAAEVECSLHGNGQFQELNELFGNVDCARTKKTGIMLVLGRYTAYPYLPTSSNGGVQYASAPQLRMRVGDCTRQPRVHASQEQMIACPQRGAFASTLCERLAATPERIGRTGFTSRPCGRLTPLPAGATDLSDFRFR